VNIGVVGIAGAWSTERLAAALAAAGADAEVIDLARCTLRLPEGEMGCAGRSLAKLDGVAVKKIGDTADGAMVEQRIQLLRWLESTGLPVLSAPDRLAAAVNRYRMTVELACAGVPVPETVVTENVGQAVAAVERFGDAVVKPLFTSKGRGMARLAPSPDLPARLDRQRERWPGPFYLQRLVEHPGRDLGIAVLDGEFLGAYWRVAAPGEWMTTVRSGGRYAPANPPPEAIELALRAAKHFGLIFTGVDLIETPGGGFLVLEVSAFGGFRGLLEACGIDAAAAMAQVLMRRFRAARS
jgi:tetrahydromethanopterin:alpha-L-glutamate ligase